MKPSDLRLMSVLFPVLIPSFKLALLRLRIISILILPNNIRCVLLSGQSIPSVAPPGMRSFLAVKKRWLHLTNGGSDPYYPQLSSVLGLPHLDLQTVLQFQNLEAAILSETTTPS